MYMHIKTAKLIHHDIILWSYVAIRFIIVRRVCIIEFVTNEESSNVKYIASVKTMIRYFVNWIMLYKTRSNIMLCSECIFMRWFKMDFAENLFIPSENRTVVVIFFKNLVLSKEKCNNVVRSTVGFTNVIFQ